MKKILLSIILSLFASTIFLSAQETAPKLFADKSGYVRVSKKDPRYFELDDGAPYIAIGLNYCFDRKTEKPDEILAHYARDFAEMKKNGVNFIRIMAFNKMLEIEGGDSKLRPQACELLDKIMQMAHENGVKVKLCMEAFRDIYGFKYRKRMNVKDMDAYLTSAECRQTFLNKVKLFADRYGDCNAVFAIELWNEMNCAKATQENILEWNKYMLPEVKKLFPKHLVVESLGSFDREKLMPIYASYMTLDSNEVAQIHRYIDFNGFDICKASLVEMAADSIWTISKMLKSPKPILLAETGGVKRGHSGPWEYYPADKDGVILHDLTFATFFAGSAGTGHVWHWDQLVIDPNNWYHYGRFNKAIKKVNVLDENFESKFSKQEDMNYYALVGRKNTMIFCRDMANTWQAELRDGTPPNTRQDVVFDLSQICPPEKIAKFKKAQFYDPWNDKWIKSSIADGKIKLPKFKRSLVLRLYE